MYLGMVLCLWWYDACMRACVYVYGVVVAFVCACWCVFFWGRECAFFFVFFLFFLLRVCICVCVCVCI